MLIGAGEQRNGVYYLKFGAGGTAFAATKIKDCDLWHQRIGHPSLGSQLIFFVDYFWFQVE